MSGSLKKFLMVLMTAAASPLFAQGEPQVIFEREVIRIFVDSSAVRVEGTYVFNNNVRSTRDQRLFYPLPVDSLHLFPRRIAVFQDGDSISYRKAPGGVAFSIRVPGGDKTVFRVSYVQDCLDNTACYILTSTSVWKQPLKAADFEIHVPEDIDLLWMAYEAETVKEDQGVIVHAFSKEDFMPDRDLCIRWRVKDGGK